MDFFELAKPRVRDIKPYEPGKYFDGRGDILKLASNENLSGISEKVRRAITEELDYLHYYPDDTSGKARSALAKEYGVEPSNLIMGNGSGEIMAFLMSAFLGATDEMIMPWPAFATFGIYARHEGAKVVRVPLDSDFRADLSAILSAVNESTRLICLDNPNNPSGTYVGEAELLRFLDAVPESVLVILDEAYCCFTDAGDYPDSTHLWKKYPNLLVCRTFSKIYALAGLRAGVAIGHESLLKVLWQVKAPFNLNRLAEAALIAALEDTEFFEKTTKHVKEMRGYIGGLLDEAGLYHPESQANYFLIDTGVDCVELGDLLIEDRIFIRPMILFGLATFIRASFPVERADADRFIETLVKNIARLRKTESACGE